VNNYKNNFSNQYIFYKMNRLKVCQKIVIEIPFKRFFIYIWMIPFKRLFNYILSGLLNLVAYCTYLFFPVCLWTCPRIMKLTATLFGRVLHVAGGKGRNRMGDFGRCKCKLIAGFASVWVCGKRGVAGRNFGHVMQKGFGFGSCACRLTELTF